MVNDYITLKLIWWGLICVLYIGFALLDGFDMGAATLIPFLGKTDTEKRVIINTVGPVWEGNQTWLVTAIGATFAAWPLVYSAAFTVMYVPLILVLFTLFLRPVGFDYRSKLSNPNWRKFWDLGLSVSGIIPPFLLGVMVGSLFTGLPFELDKSMRVVFTGNPLSCFNAFSLLTGVISVLMTTVHGASYIQLKTEGVLRERARLISLRLIPLVALLFIVAGWVVFHKMGAHIYSLPNLQGSFTPQAKSVTWLIGGWQDNFKEHPLVYIVPVIGLLGLLLAFVFSFKGKTRLSILGSGIAVIGIIGTAAAALFPFIITSSTNPACSLTLWDAVSSQKTLNLLLLVSIVFVPIILVYTSWVYRVLRGPVTEAHIESNQHTVY